MADAPPGPIPLVRTTRSGVQEAVHLGSVAVADPEGRAVAWAGDPHIVTFARSTMKPLQATVSLRAAGEDLTDREVAVMCGSHNGEPVHVDAVRSILERAHLGFDALRCPPDVPLDLEAARSVSEPRPELHNCSGKHAGMVLACVRAGWDPATYPQAGHPLQRTVLDAVRAWAREPVAVGVDGCGVPVHAVPLLALATLYARLARPSALGPLEPWALRAARGMRGQPYLVGGRDRLCTRIMETVPGAVVKVGGAGVVCASLEPGIGVAVKIADGSIEAAGTALLHAMRSLGTVPDRGAESLARFARPVVTGGGVPVGESAAEFDLRPA